MSGTSSTKRSPLVSRLQDFVERLTSPELTAAEAEGLRPGLFELLDQIDTQRDPWVAALNSSTTSERGPCAA
jgi:hypothetical protein